MGSSGAQEINRVGPDSWAWASSPGAFTVLPWCELLRVLCPAPAGATSPGRTRDGAWALKPWETGFPGARPHGMRQQRREKGHTQHRAEHPAGG